MSELSCAILAGGKSSRIGSYKALIRYKGLPLILHVIDELYDFFNDIVISVKNISQRDDLMRTLYSYGYNRVRVLVDPITRIYSPLVGLYTCLLGSRNDYVFVTACDMPNISSRVVVCLYEELEEHEYNAVVPIWPNGFIEPLCAIYSKYATLKTLIDALSYGDYSLKYLIKRLKDVKYLLVHVLKRKGVSLKTFYNVNELSDFRSL